MTGSGLSSRFEVLSDAPLAASESYSSLSTYQLCPRRYAYHYVERLPGEVSPDQFAFGAAIHHAFEMFVRQRVTALTGGGPVPGGDVLMATFNEAIGASGCTADAVARYRVRARPAIARFLEWDLARDAEPIGVEMGFGVDLDVPGDAVGVRFVGYIDRIDRVPDGSIEVIDYKSGSPKGQADVDGNLQLTAYAFALAHGGVSDPADGAVLPPAARLGLYFADGGQTVWTTRSPADLDTFRCDLLAVVRQVREHKLETRPSPPKCSWCEYRRLCPEAAA